MQLRISTLLWVICESEWSWWQTCCEVRWSDIETYLLGQQRVCSRLRKREKKNHFAKGPGSRHYSSSLTGNLRLIEWHITSLFFFSLWAWNIVSLKTSLNKVTIQFKKRKDWFLMVLFFLFASPDGWFKSSWGWRTMIVILPWRLSLPDSLNSIH